jgi:hypothetical protein
MSTKKFEVDEDEVFMFKGNNLLEFEDPIFS